jgi:CheY-like chemotaxis protein
MQEIECVLIIEDDEATNFLTVRTLQKSGVVNQIVVRNDGKQALEYLANVGGVDKDGRPVLKPNLILLDINMPGMDGWEFLEEYKKLESTAKGDVILVMLTTSLNQDDEERAKNIKEINDFINKPLVSDKFVELAKKHLYRK